MEESFEQIKAHRASKRVWEFWFVYTTFLATKGRWTLTQRRNIGNTIIPILKAFTGNMDAAKHTLQLGRTYNPASLPLKQLADCLSPGTKTACLQQLTPESVEEKIYAKVSSQENESTRKPMKRTPLSDKTQQSNATASKVSTATKDRSSSKELPGKRRSNDKGPLPNLRPKTSFRKLGGALRVPASKSGRESAVHELFSNQTKGANSTVRTQAQKVRFSQFASNLSPVQECHKEKEPVNDSVASSSGGPSDTSTSTSSSGNNQSALTASADVGNTDHSRILNISCQTTGDESYANSQSEKADAKPSKEGNTDHSFIMPSYMRNWDPYSSSAQNLQAFQPSCSKHTEHADDKKQEQQHTDTNSINSEDDDQGSFYLRFEPRSVKLLSADGDKPTAVTDNPTERTKRNQKRGRCEEEEPKKAFNAKQARTTPDNDHDEDSDEPALSENLLNESTHTVTFKREPSRRMTAAMEICSDDSSSTEEDDDDTVETCGQARETCPQISESSKLSTNEQSEGRQTQEEKDSFHLDNVISFKSNRGNVSSGHNQSRASSTSSQGSTKSGNQHEENQPNDPYSEESQQKAISSFPQAREKIIVNGIPYVKLNIIGRGGSSKVYRVMGADYEIYALKKVKLTKADAPSVQNFTNEIALLDKLRGCSNIVHLVDSEVNLKERTICVVMELGEIDLNRLLQRERENKRKRSGDASAEHSSVDGQNEQLYELELEENFVRLVWQQMLQAVETIHDSRIVHGDLKPANFVFVQGTLKLIDFGIAKAISNNTTNIYRETQVGTLNYMSPEAILDTSGNGPGKRTNSATSYMKLGRASDIWSMGCILYQMTYGKTPFADLSLIQKIHCITDPSYEIHFPKIKGGHEPIIDIIRQCLARDPRQRPSMEELLEHPFLQPHKSIPANQPRKSVVTFSECELTQMLTAMSENEVLAYMNNAKKDEKENIINKFTRTIMDRLHHSEDMSSIRQALVETVTAESSKKSTQRSGPTQTGQSKRYRETSLKQRQTSKVVQSSKVSNLQEALQTQKANLKKVSHEDQRKSLPDEPVENDLVGILKRGLNKKFANVEDTCGGDDDTTDLNTSAL